MLVQINSKIDIFVVNLQKLNKATTQADMFRNLNV
jgi:hypothetical protein